MKTVLILTLFSLALLLNNKAYAQLPNDDSTERIVVELYLLDEYVAGKNGKPLPTNVLEVTNESKEFEELVGGGFATVECTKCPLSAEYSFYVTKVEKIGDTEARIFFDVSFKGWSKCNTASSLTVKRDRANIFELKCRPKAKVIAYFKPRKTNNERRATNN